MKGHTYVPTQKSRVLSMDGPMWGHCFHGLELQSLVTFSLEFHLYSRVTLKDVFATVEWLNGLDGVLWHLPHLDLYNIPEVLTNQYFLQKQPLWFDWPSEITMLRAVNGTHGSFSSPYPYSLIMVLFLQEVWWFLGLSLMFFIMSTWTNSLILSGMNSEQWKPPSHDFVQFWKCQ